MLRIFRTSHAMNDELWAIKMVMTLFEENQVLNAPKATSLADQTRFEFVVEKIMHDPSG